MNILQLSKSLHRGGVEDHILTLTRNLQNLGHHVVVASDNLVEKEAFDKAGIKVYLIKFRSKNPYNFFKNIKDMKKIIQDEKIDVIHCHWRICSFYCEWLRKLINISVPYVWTSHLAVVKNTPLHRLGTYCGDKTIAVSSDCKKMLMEELKIVESQISIIYNGISIHKYTNLSEAIVLENQRRFETKGRYVVVQLSRLSEIKNHACLIRAVDIAVNKFGIENLLCLITGEGDAQYREMLVHMIEEKKLENNISLVGQVNAVDVLCVSDVMVLPSNAEGFPVSVLEGFAMKLPVIRTKTGGYKDVKSFCLPMEFDDEEQLAVYIRDLYEGKINVEDITKSAYEFIVNECTDIKMTERILKIYEDVRNEEEKGESVK